MSDLIVKEGPLTKEGKVFKTWKKRHFELREHTMTYFDKKEGKMKGKFIVYGGLMALAPDKNKKFPHTFQIVTDSRTWFLSAETDSDLKEWMSALLQQGAKLADDSMFQMVFGELKASTPANQVFESPRISNDETVQASISTLHQLRKNSLRTDEALENEKAQVSTNKAISSIEDAINQLTQAPESEPVIQSCTRYLLELSQSRDISQEILNCNGVQPLMYAAKSHYKDKIVMFDIMIVLSYVAANGASSEHSNQLRNNDFLNFASRLLKMYRDNPVLLMSLQQLLIIVFMKPSVYNIQFLQSAGFKSLLETFKLHQDNLDYVSDCLKLFCLLCTEKGCIEMFLLHDGIKYMMSALRLHRENAEVILGYITSFTNKAISYNAVNLVVERLMEERSIQFIIIECMGNHHIEQCKITQMAMKLTKNLAENNLIMRTIVYVMRDNLHINKIALNSATLLYNLRNRAYLEGFIQSDSISVLLQGLELYSKDYWFIKFAMETLRFLVAKNNKCQNLFIQNKGIQIALDILSNFITDEEIAFLVIKVIYHLTDNDDIAQLLMQDERTTSLVLKAMNEHSTSENLLQSTLKILVDLIAVTDTLDPPLVPAIVCLVLKLLDQHKEAPLIVERSVILFFIICEQFVTYQLKTEEANILLLCLTMHQDDEAFVAVFFDLITSLTVLEHNCEIFAGLRCGVLLQDIIAKFQHSEKVQSSLKELTETLERWNKFM